MSLLSSLTQLGPPVHPTLVITFSKPYREPHFRSKIIYQTTTRSFDLCIWEGRIDGSGIYSVLAGHYFST
jgi:hypothetical protein